MLEEVEREHKEESKEDQPGLVDSEPLSLRWSKEALKIVTQNLTEQQQISLLSE